MTLAWTQVPGDPVTAMPGPIAQAPIMFPGGIPGCQGTASANVPALAVAVQLHDTFPATIGEFSNTGTVQVNAATRVRHTALVLDRTGSMSGVKWDNAAKGATSGSICWRPFARASTPTTGSGS